jgi:DNA-binding CsgD family transcriptional regulator
LRDSDEEIGECVKTVFEKRQAVPSYLRDRVDEYRCLTDIEPHLTHREIEIVRYAAEGKTVKETGSVLMVSERTVTGHLCNIYQKFRVRNKVEVLKLAVAKGILAVEEIMRFSK